MFCTAAAAAIDTEEEDNWCAVTSAIIDMEGKNLNGDFNNLIGAKTSGFDNLNYSSDDDVVKDYHQEIENKARLIEYSDANKVTHGQRQTNIICGSLQPPDYLGMTSAELAEAKREHKRERKRYTNGLRMKHLNKQNKDFEQDSFIGCPSLSLRPLMDVKVFWLDVNQTFPNREVLVIHVTEEANLLGVNFICR